MSIMHALGVETPALRLRNRVSELPRLAAWTDELCRSLGLPDRIRHDLRLALEEVVTNVISHAYRNDAAHEIVVRASTRADGLEVEVEDDGVEFDPLAVPPPDTTVPLEERAVGGLGIHLIRHAVDAVRYRRRDGKNVLALFKRVGV